MRLNKIKFFAQVEKFALSIFQLFGFFPTFIEERSDFATYFLKFWSFWMIFFITLNISSVVENKETIFHDTSVGKVNDILKYATVTLACYIIIFESLCNASRFQKVYQKFKLFDKECENLKVNFGLIRKRMEKNFAVHFISLLCMQLVCEAFIISYIPWPEFWRVNIFSATICRIRHIQYIYYLHLIHTKVAILRSQLGKIVDYSEIRLLSSDEAVYQETLNILQTVKTAYGILWDATFNVNEIFTWSLTANLIQTFVQVGCDSYWAYLSVSEDYNWLASSSVILVSLIFQPAILISLLLNKANQVKIDALKIPVQLHSIRKAKHEVDLYKMVRFMSEAASQ